MLGLFKEEEEESLTHEGLLQRSREILVSYLNKGIVPSWEQYFKELPIMNDAQDLEIIKNNFHKLTEWTFLQDILILDGTEYFFHHPQKSQVLTKRGEKVSFKVPLTLEEWQLWLEIISIQFKQNWNVSCPFASFYGEIKGHNFRLSLIHSSTSPQGLS